MYIKNIFSQERKKNYMKRYVLLMLLAIGFVFPIIAQTADQVVTIDASQATDTSVARYQTFQEALVQFNPGGLYYENPDISPNIFSVLNTKPVGTGTGQIRFILTGSTTFSVPGDPNYCRCTVIVRSDPSNSGRETYTGGVPTTEHRPIILLPETGIAAGLTRFSIAISSTGVADYVFQDLIFMPPALADFILGTGVSNNGDAFCIDWKNSDATDYGGVDTSATFTFKNCLFTSNAGDTTPGCYRDGLYGNDTVVPTDTIVGDDYIQMESTYPQASYATQQLNRAGPTLTFDNCILTHANDWGVLAYGGIYRVINGSRFDYSPGRTVFDLYAGSCDFQAIGTPSVPISFSNNGYGSGRANQGVSSNAYGTNFHIQDGADLGNRTIATFQYCNFNNCRCKQDLGQGFFLSANYVVATAINCNFIQNSILPDTSIPPNLYMVFSSRTGATFTMQSCTLSWNEPGKGTNMVHFSSAGTPLVLDIENSNFNHIDNSCGSFINLNYRYALSSTPSLTIKGCKFTGNMRAALTTTDYLSFARYDSSITPSMNPLINIENSVFSGGTSGRHMLFVSGAAGFTMRTCQIVNANQQALNITGNAVIDTIEKSSFHQWGLGAPAGGVYGIAIDNVNAPSTQVTQFTKCTFHSSQAVTSPNYVMEMNAADSTQVNVVDSIFSGNGYFGIYNQSTVGGTINVSNSAFATGQSSPAINPEERLAAVYQVGAGAVNLTNDIYMTPYYQDTATSIPLGASYLDVGNSLYAGLGSGGSNLAGADDFVGNVITSCVASETKNITLPGYYVYTVGTAGAAALLQTPMALKMTSVTTTADPATVAVSVTDAKHPNANDSTGHFGGQYFVSRYFTATPSGISVITTDVTLSFTAADSTDAGLSVPYRGVEVAKWNGAIWTWSQGVETRGNELGLYKVTWPGVTLLSDWTVSGPGGLPVELSRFEIEAITEPLK
jgi:hypothetical protein